MAVFLPHKIYYPIYKFICTNTLFYKKYSWDSFEKAKIVLDDIQDKEDWNRKVKLLYLIDFTDYWLARFRPKKLMKLLRKNGSWDSRRGHLALSIHFGPGYVTLLDLKQNHFNPFFVYSEPQVDFKFQSFVESQYRKTREKHINRISGSMAITTGGGYDKIKKYKIASGFINLICNENIEFQMYSVKFNFDDGYKQIDIEELSHIQSVESLIKKLSHFFENLVLSNPEQWYFWRQSEQLFELKHEK